MCASCINNCNIEFFSTINAEYFYLNKNKFLNSFLQKNIIQNYSELKNFNQKEIRILSDTENAEIGSAIAFEIDKKNVSYLATKQLEKLMTQFSKTLSLELLKKLSETDNHLFIRNLT